MGGLIIFFFLIPVTGIIILYLIPGKFQKDACGCSVRYTDKRFLDPVYLITNEHGMLECTENTCQFNVLNELKLLTKYIDFK